MYYPSVKVCKEFNWDSDGRDMEMAQGKIAAVGAVDRKSHRFRMALDNT